jgi:hypothetical protein
MTAITQDYQITWEKLPDDYKLPNDPSYCVSPNQVIC